MTDIYNCERNVKVVTTPNGDKVITMNREIFTNLIVNLYEGKALQRQEGRDATADTTQCLINALDKEE